MGSALSSFSSLMGSVLSSCCSPSLLSLPPAPPAPPLPSPPAPLPPPPTRPEIKYDVFLSFRGEDTRYKFISHVEKAFRDKGIIDHFIDSKLRRGDEISSSLLQAIEESWISVVIFSKNYGNSRWCLEELVKILECKKNYGQIVIPIFYEIDPSHVRNGTGSSAYAFAEHQKRFKKDLHKAKKWKDALNEAANLCGLDSRVIKSESALVEKIVEDVVERLNNMPSSDNKKLVGIESKIAKIEAMLGMRDQMNNDVRKVGICGIGGIGKTTLAKAVFDKIFDQFEGSYFSGSVREAEEKNELNGLKRELYSVILKEGIAYICTPINRRLSRKEVLIVFDDVTSFKQIEVLIGDLEHFGMGSRIIITSRDRQVLKKFCVKDDIYDVQELCFNGSLELFSRHAFKQNCPKVDYKELSKGVVEKVGGVPLALKVLGSFLLDKRKEVWESSMEKLKNILDRDIHEVLKISYDELDDMNKRIFLDIACFYKGWDVNLVTAIMDASGFFTASGISALEDKCLITILDNKLIMHDLLQTMGKTIVHQESVVPGKRTRLYNHNDIYEVLANATGTPTIEGISWDMSNTGDIQLHPCTFENMHCLRFLRFYISNHQSYNNNSSGVHVPQDLKFGLIKLRYFQWERCPLKSLPYLRDLVILDLSDSNVEQLWSGVQQFGHLKEINLRRSKNLIRFPDLRAPKLQYLGLQGCTSLMEMPSSFQHFSLLVRLNFYSCEKLKNVPELPESLQYLLLERCSKLEKLPESIQHLTKLYNLNLGLCISLTGIPDCSCLTSLRKLALFDCSKLERLSEIPSNFKLLHLSGCASLFEIPSSFNHLNQLVSLRFVDCKSLTSIPDLGGLKSLKYLRIERCSKLKTLPELPNSIEKLYLEEMPIEELPPSFEHLCTLRELSLVDYSRLKSLPRSFCSMWKSLLSIDIRRCEDALSGSLLPLLIHCLHNLTSLRLSECRITEITDSVGCLTSLQTLELERNNFERIPESIINLSKLKRLNISHCGRLKVLPKLIGNLSNLEHLNISHCERLKVLPKLPWARIDALNCTSLQEVSCPSLPSNLFALNWIRIMSAVFVNCFNLDRNSLDNFVKDAELELQAQYPSWDLHALSALSSSLRSIWRIRLSICYPGTEIPKWFVFRSNQSYLDWELPLDGISDKLLCFALCAVVSCRDQNAHDCYDTPTVDYCIWDSNEDFIIKRGSPMGPMGDASSHYASHVHIGFVLHFFPKHQDMKDNKFIRFKFKVKVMQKQHFEVEKCGVRLICSRYLSKDESEILMTY